MHTVFQDINGGKAAVLPYLSNTKKKKASHFAEVLKMHI